MSNPHASAATLIVLNPHAGSGRAKYLWDDLHASLRNRLGTFSVVITEQPEDVAPQLADAARQGIRRVIAIGGDGTNHIVINDVIRQNGLLAPHDQIVYGNIPIGTGRDWARGLGFPTQSVAAMSDWIARATPRPIDVGVLTDHDTQRREYFLNIASTGLGGDVVLRVNSAEKRRAWTFFLATVQSILHYQPQHIRVRIDGAAWYEGRVYVLAVANGSTFGRGMQIAPHAVIDDGLFEVVLVKAVSRLEILSAFQRVYRGTHLTHPAVLYTRAKQVEVEAVTPDAHAAIGLELDGEFRSGRALTFEVRPALLHFLR
ncbi:MAG: diacylglycerol kinase family lipid kinase [bacterium]|nr:diacylglycerol kinase family lipid kinase [bacterium]